MIIQPVHPIRSLHIKMDDLIEKEFRARYYNKNGVQQGPVFFPLFYERMYTLHPNHRAAMKPALKRLDSVPVYSKAIANVTRFIKNLSYTYCDGFPKDDKGEFLDATAAYSHLQNMRPDLDNVTTIWDV